MWEEIHTAYGVKGHEFIYIPEYFINGRFQFQMSINSIGRGGKEHMQIYLFAGNQMLS